MYFAISFSITVSQDIKKYDHPSFLERSVKDIKSVVSPYWYFQKGQNNLNFMLLKALPKLSKT